MARRNIAIVTGGDSLESASSFASARNIYANLDQERFNRFLLSVENWRWRLIEADCIAPAQRDGATLDSRDFTLAVECDTIRFDAAFIAIHGAPAETGHLQAYFELVGLPYTGSGILASALAMDKQACKHFLAHATGVSIPRHHYVRGEGPDPAAVRELGFPCIVKPNAYGSGMGVVLAANETALAKAVARARALGRDVLIEEFIQGREFTVGALIIGGRIEILPIAEVFREDPARDLHARGQYSFTDRQSASIRFDPDLDQDTARALCRKALEIGQALKCRSFYRADFMLDGNREIYFLELNTIPGMTPRSVFTRQLAHGNFKESDIFNQIVVQELA